MDKRMLEFVSRWLTRSCDSCVRKHRKICSVDSVLLVTFSYHMEISKCSHNWSYVLLGHRIHRHSIGRCDLLQSAILSMNPYARRQSAEKKKSSIQRTIKRRIAIMAFIIASSAGQWSMRSVPPRCTCRSSSISRDVCPPSVPLPTSVGRQKSAIELGSFCRCLYRKCRMSAGVALSAM